MWRNVLVEHPVTAFESTNHTAVINFCIAQVSTPMVSAVSDVVENLYSFCDGVKFNLCHLYIVKERPVIMVINFEVQDRQ